MQKAGGYFRAVDPTLPEGRTVIEYDTIQCRHCQRVVFVKPGSGMTVYLIPLDLPHQFREEPGAWCGRCMGPICLPCHAAGRCRPFELWLDEQESKIQNKLSWGRFFRFIGIGR